MKIAVLGLGSIGLRHAKNLRKLGADVIGYDIDETKMREFQGKVVSRDFALMQCDAVLVATPTSEHSTDINNVVTLNKPIFVEKPIAHKHSHPNWEFKNTWVGYMLRFHPCIQFAREKMAQIGDPIWASFTVAQYNDKPAYLADGVVLNWSHEIDLALYLFGPAKVIASHVDYRDGQDVIADFVLKHDSGVRSTIHLDYVTKQEIRESWIVGTEKNIGIDLVGGCVSWGRIVQQFGGGWDGVYINEMAAWLKALEGESTELATGQDGVEVVKICEQVRDRSYKDVWAP